MRCRVFNETQLTCSVGLGPNTMLAKVASDINKPNGQFVLPDDPTALKDFVQSLSLRKVPGIGKVCSPTSDPALGTITARAFFWSLSQGLHAPHQQHHLHADWSQSQQLHPSLLAILVFSPFSTDISLSSLCMLPFLLPILALSTHSPRDSCKVPCARQAVLQEYPYASQSAFPSVCCM